jgi:hypothetical protein
MTNVSTTPPEPGDKSAGPEELIDQLREAHVQSGLETIKYALRDVAEESQDSDLVDAQPHSSLAGDVDSAERMADNSRQTIDKIFQEDDLGLDQVVKLVRPTQGTSELKRSAAPIRPADVTSIEDVRRLAEMQFGHYGFKDSNDIA